jgi:hypothetical protein
MTFHEKMETFSLNIEKQKGEWFLENLKLIDVRNAKTITFSELKTSFETKFEHFELFWYSKPINEMREQGLLVL